MSAYNGELTPVGMATALKRLKDSFPELNNGFHDVLGERVFELGFDDQRFLHAVNYVVDNCIYPKPTIAQFLTYDSKVEYLNHEQYIKKNNELHGMVSKFYKSVRVSGYDKPFWAHENDISKYKLELFNK